jgi:hypothetical protein
MDLIFAILFAVLFEQTLGSNIACHEVRYAYSAKGMNIYDVPLKPQTGKIIFQI